MTAAILYGSTLRQIEITLTPRLPENGHSWRKTNRRRSEPGSTRRITGALGLAKELLLPKLNTRSVVSEEAK